MNEFDHFACIYVYKVLLVMLSQIHICVRSFVRVKTYH